MWRRALGVCVFLILIYFFKTCRDENQEILISDVKRDSSWIYDMVSIPLGERQFAVLIDGELDDTAKLVSQTEIMGLPYEKGVIFTKVTFLPPGKFSLYINQDDSGPEKFIYRPLKATKGWIGIRIKPGQWNYKDSTRRSPYYRTL